MSPTAFSDKHKESVTARVLGSGTSGTLVDITVAACCWADSSHF